MKVQSHAIQAYARTALNPAAPAPPVAEPPPPAADEAAHVTLSAEARQLAVQRAGVDQEKVDGLREKVSTGELRINPQILAMRILDAFGRPEA
jgi:flagellar biosynthesis anti-sigma factor FlgM